MNPPTLHFEHTRRLISLLTLTLLLGFNGCLPDSGPQGTVGRFLEALAKNDQALAESLATPESKGIIGLISDGSRLTGKANRSGGFDPARVEIGKAAIEGDQATVPVKEKKSGVVFNYRLKKVDGQWKVAFDMASLLSMTAGTLEEQIERGIDSLKSGLENLRDINLDSVAGQLREGQRKLDSMQQIIEQEFNKGLNN
jgi:hypothetical protein